MTSLRHFTRGDQNERCGYPPGVANSVGFVGLGVMGGPMAGHLARAGVPLIVWNRTPVKAQPLADLGVTIASSLEDLARASTRVILCVSRTEDVLEVLAQIVPHLEPGALVIDHSTIAPPAAQQIHQDLARHEVRFVDAPITGGSMGAQNGTLTIFLGGSEADTAEAKDLVQPYTKRAERVGGAGAGQMAKMANQIAVAGSLLALCESMSFAQKAGLDLAQIRSLLAGGAAGSWNFENYGPKLLNHDWTPGFSIRNQLKDLAYCREAARTIEAALPTATLAEDLLARLLAEGRGEEATVALYDLFLKMGAEA